MTIWSRVRRSCTGPWAFPNVAFDHQMAVRSIIGPDFVRIEFDWRQCPVPGRCRCNVITLQTDRAEAERRALYASGKLRLVTCSAHGDCGTPTAYGGRPKKNQKIRLRPRIAGTRICRRTGRISKKPRPS